MTSRQHAGTDADGRAPRGRSRRVAVLGATVAVCLTAAGVLSVQGVREPEAPAHDLLSASPSIAALQAAAPTTSRAMAAASSTAFPESSTAAAPARATTAASSAPASPAPRAAATTATASTSTVTASTSTAPASVSASTAAKPAPQPAAATTTTTKAPAATAIGTATLPAPPAQPMAASVYATRPLVPVERFGAAGDGVRDDTAALQKALDSVPANSVLQLRAGATYLHSDVLRLTRPDVAIAGTGATLLATNEARSAFHVTASASRAQVTGVTFGLTASTRRWDAPAQDKVRVWASDVVLRDVHVQGAAAAGIFMDGAARFLLDRVTVSDSRADGIHMSRGARDGRVVSPVTNRTGDDGVAVVSYRSDGVVSARIQITSPTVNGTTWGRGISVVGGDDISYTDVTIRDTDAAAVYIGSEGDPYWTFPSRRVLVRGGTVTGANANVQKDHGALMVYSGNVGTQTSDVTLQDLTLRDTRTSATWNAGVLADPGAYLNRISLSGLTLVGGPALPVYTSTPSAVRVTGLVDDGAPFAYRSGW
ncbi:glycosyl hydrolase family 28-related protein [Modestobacter sp. SSW1-42]|uniref:glycosyl hydrolase family 28-related protein n=1 Tax=Modestobacter sp. SSW1-42 TaxID=596372 RepID=UPI003987BD60